MNLDANDDVIETKGDLMRLNFEQICSITTGAVSVVKETSGVRFYRFTDEQFALYENRCEKFFQKSKTTSGIKLRFRTNSRKLYLRFLVDGHIGASFMAFDVYVNEKMIGSLNNFTGVNIPRSYLKTEFPIGEFSDEFELGAGDKLVTVHLPWNGSLQLQEISLDNGSFVEPSKPDKKLLALGDSITYGNAAMHPSARYIARLCDALDAEEYNKGIGGEFFFPELAATRESFTPDYIVVAYGTNDWRKLPQAEFRYNVKGFFENLNASCPGVKTIVITPIWRSNLHVDTDFDSIHDVALAIREAADVLENKIIVDGFDLVPHDVSHYGDYGCHPNDEGFRLYFENLWKQIRDAI